jgi:D-sedoheptulose 7-phosphate isomerase
MPTTTANTELVSKIQSMFAESIAVKQQLMEEHAGDVLAMAELITESLQRGGKLLLCGNGGSAADAQHLAAELLVRLRPNVNRDGIAALALATDTSSLTACGNDYAFDDYYERLVRALGRPGDVLIGITTSGRSRNIVRALRAARDQQMTALGLLGDDGGDALGECDLALIVPSRITGRIQEAHITIGHALMEVVEDLLISRGFLTSPKTL